jgi:hypothetical protein
MRGNLRIGVGIHVGQECDTDASRLEKEWPDSLGFRYACSHPPDTSGVEERDGALEAGSHAVKNMIVGYDRNVETEWSNVGSCFAIRVECNPLVGTDTLRAEQRCFPVCDSQISGREIRAKELDVPSDKRMMCWLQELSR